MAILLELMKEQGLDQKKIDLVQELLQLDQSLVHLINVQNLLEWDQSVMMPSRGTESRSEQMAVVEKHIHEADTHPRIPELLHAAGVTEENRMGDPTFPEAVRLWLRAKYRKWHSAASIPPALLQEIVKLSVCAHHVWVRAKADNNFDSFAPYLEKTIALQRERADCIGYHTSRYNALLDEFEIGMTTDILTPLFKELATKLTPVYARAIEKSRTQSVPSILLTVSEQEKFCAYITSVLGFDASIGRLDISAHPFSTHIGKNDARITTRYTSDAPLSSMFSVLHELGHAFYDMGIHEMYRDTVCDAGASHGVHESQSMFLENVIGKSVSFWKYHYPKLQDIAPRMKDISLDNFMDAIHVVTPNVIRVDSDEVGYGFHVVLRYEIEKELIEGTLSAHDVPELWKSKSEEYLGVRPTNDAQGVLQDVHWSQGAFGYFPSYALGKMYSANLFSMLQDEVPEYSAHLEKGSYAEIRTWLVDKVHRHGAAKLPKEILSLSVDTVIDYFKTRYI